MGKEKRKAQRRERRREMTPPEGSSRFRHGEGERFGPQVNRRRAVRDGHTGGRHSAKVKGSNIFKN